MGLEGSLEKLCEAGGRRERRPGWTGLRRNSIHRTARGGRPEGGQKDGREVQHAPTTAPRPAAAPGRHADLPGAPARAQSPTSARARARRPPAHLALAQPTRLFRPFHCVRDMGFAVVSEEQGE